MDTKTENHVLFSSVLWPLEVSRAWQKGLQVALQNTTGSLELTNSQPLPVSPPAGASQALHSDRRGGWEHRKGAKVAC